MVTMVGISVLVADIFLGSNLVISDMRKSLKGLQVRAYGPKFDTSNKISW